MPFEFKKLAIPDIILIAPKVLGDRRGFFIETYKQEDFKMAGIDIPFIQDNHSKSVKNVLRGLHYQKNPKAQGKLIRCIKGKILDVGVDIRKGSPYYGKWVSHIISEENNLMLYIPPGFAHGFLVLSHEAEVLYKTTEEYSPDHDRGILWDDQEIGIDWVIKEPELSEKDKRLPTLKEADNNFTY